MLHKAVARINLLLTMIAYAEWMKNSASIVAIWRGEISRLRGYANAVCHMHHSAGAKRHLSRRCADTRQRAFIPSDNSGFGRDGYGCISLAHAAR